MEAAIFIMLFLTSDELVFAFKALALLFCAGYAIAQALISYSESENRKATEQMLQEAKARAESSPQVLAIQNAMQNAMQKSNTIATKEKEADSGGSPTVYVTDEERALAKKLAEEMRNAGLG
ncbi:hypothetical protein OR1_03139 [Geobacter sp. OR-1]|uniref:hypothetical protein n=1 Tax=Geobacter sp. OR-1 TaxID=1266765 RepID=UPI000541F567|nr:hypothetical protein [Geobacter sp. OR-1]GAM10840.1 hypothetical protein OR1_03139 [Geobacter sp. OR-1]